MLAINLVRSSKVYVVPSNVTGWLCLTAWHDSIAVAEEIDFGSMEGWCRPVQLAINTTQSVLAKKPK